MWSVSFADLFCLLLFVLWGVGFFLGGGVGVFLGGGEAIFFHYYFSFYYLLSYKLEITLKLTVRLLVLFIMSKLLFPYFYSLPFNILKTKYGF